MSDPNDLFRIFYLTDDEMLQESKIKLGLFIGDKPAFISFDPDFDDPFEANWQNDIDAAEDFDSDETVLGQQRQLTEAVEQKNRHI